MKKKIEAKYDPAKIEAKWPFFAPLRLRRIGATKGEQREYKPSLIEQKWQKKWKSSKLFKTKEDTKKDKYYVLDMFPYPSGEGLHVGHPKGYIATDVISRMKRMQGYSVLHPMGFDAFGLPAENYALKMKKNPMDLTSLNIKRFKKQLEILGFDYDWSREVNTTDPKYYKWTQWIFLQLWKKGLAYQSYEPINWCPSCKTGLANEDVEDGRCERCGTPVEKKPMKQWILKITDYAERLLEDLDTRQYERPKVVDKVNPHQENKPLVQRNVAHAIVFDPRTQKYLIIRNKKYSWDTVIIGGIEEGESAIETARREVREETGYVDIEFKRLLGEQTEAHYYTKHKGENRVAVAQAVYFELNSDKQVPRAEGEDEEDEILWVSKEDFVPGKLVNSELHIWLERIKDPTKGFSIPLLDWPESIKEAQRNWIGKSEGAEINFPIKKDVNFVLLHGWEGSPERNFFPWLRSELEKAGHRVQVPILPNTDHPNVKEQVEAVLHRCTFDEKTVLLGHSLGATVAMKVIERLNKPINTLVLAAGFIENRFKDGSTFDLQTHDWEYDFETISKKVKNIIILQDLDDCVVLDDQADKIKVKLGGTVKVFKAEESHICAEKEPFLLSVLQTRIKVFTTRPDTIFGATYLVLAPEHDMVKELLPSIPNKKEVEDYIGRAKSETEIERTDMKKEKTGVQLKGVGVINPANKEEIPVWISDYVLADYGTGAVMAVPAHDERDWEFAKKFDLAIKQVVAPLFTENSGPDAPRSDKKDSRRRNVLGIVKHWSEDKYICLNWKQTGWHSLIVGGAEDKEDDEIACEREITEETGYKNLKFIRKVGPEVHTYHYTPHKDHNRYGYCQVLYFELKDGEQGEIEEHEKSKHEVVWIEKNKVADYLNLKNNLFLWDIFLNNEKGFTGDGILINSSQFNDKESHSIKREITEFVGGKWVTKYKLRDWVFSRQRYWGEPIPMVHCERCALDELRDKAKISLNFYYEPVWKSLIIGEKSLETRALNPEEKDRYFGDIKVGDILLFVFRDKETKKIRDEKLFKITNRKIYHSFTELFNDKEALSKLHKKDYGSAEELEHSYLSYGNNYVEKIKRNGLIAWHIEPVTISIPVPEKDLPIKLPKVKSYEPTGTGESPLAAIAKWVNTKCPKCRGKAKRETHTMPQWAGSSWYYLRYEDPKNKKALVDPKKDKYWSPVDLYVGGAEHATRHLIYARFWHKFLHDIGVVSTREPFTKLQNVGLIMGEDGRKMSKRFGNVVNPDLIVKTYGADTLRIYEMFMGPFDQQIAWNTNSMIGSRRFIEKVWKLSEKVALDKDSEGHFGPSEGEGELAAAPAGADGVSRGTLSSATLNKTLHKTIKKVTEDIQDLKFNTALSTLMIAVNEMETSKSVTKEQFEILLKLLAPFAPHVAEELWTMLGNKKSIHVSTWPQFDTNLVVDEVMHIVVQVNGKVRGSFDANLNINEEEMKKKALDLSEVKKWVDGKQVKKTIIVKGKLVSIVI